MWLNIRVIISEEQIKQRREKERSEREIERSMAKEMVSFHFVDSYLSAVIGIHVFVLHYFNFPFSLHFCVLSICSTVSRITLSN